MWHEGMYVDSQMLWDLNEVFASAVAPTYEAVIAALMAAAGRPRSYGARVLR